MAPSSVVVTIEKPSSISLVEISDSKSSVFQEKQKAASTKQVTWVLLLRAQRLFSCISWLAMAFRGTFSSIKKRVALSDIGEEDPKYRGRLYSFIRLFLAISVVALVIEIIAYFQKWDLKMIHPWEVQGLVHWSYMAWLSFRVDYVAPVIITLSKFCIVLFMIQSVDRLALGIGCFWIKYKKLKPEIKGEAYDIEDCSSFPMVLVQIPMCNEKEVFATSITAACQLDWPKDRFLIQVLDDSDDELLQLLIRNEVSLWKEKGVNIVYRHRFIRTGYKAGNLKSAMSCDYVKDYEFVAIFDADFLPNPDYLKQTVPHFKGNPDLALVQARWSFVNKDENLLTRLQNINLCFHFEVEQQVNGFFLNFFGFNGTAGVWRIKALEESGGWLERTTVEDMDIAVRAHLNGWKFIYLNDVRVLCELPESYEAYKKQQHRWHSGPMQLFRLCLPAVLSSKISKWKKANLIFLFFLLRKLILPFYSFTLFCIILPLTMFIPEAELPVWVICYVPITMSILNILPAPKSFPFLMPYLLFENTMSVTKFNAMVSGLFQLGSSYEWIVTKKTGRSSESDLFALAERESKTLNEEKIQRRLSESGLEMLGKLKEQEAPVVKKRNKLYRKELALAFLLLTAAARSLLSAHGIHFYYLLFQGLSFLVVGLDLIGEQVDAAAFAAMVMLEIGLVVMSTLAKAAMNKGLSNFVFAVYHNSLGILILLPYFIFHTLLRKCLLMFGNVGLCYSSPALTAAIANLIPIFTFLLAIIFRMEKIDTRSSSSRAKLLGTILAVSGAFLLTLDKGPAIIMFTSTAISHHRINLPQQSKWLLGGLFLAIAYFFKATWNVLQAVTVKEYPAEGLSLFLPTIWDNPDSNCHACCRKKFKCLGFAP